METVTGWQLIMSQICCLYVVNHLISALMSKRSISSIKLGIEIVIRHQQGPFSAHFSPHTTLLNVFLCGSQTTQREHD